MRGRIIDKLKGAVGIVEVVLRIHTVYHLHNESIFRGGSRISGKGVHMYKGLCVGVHSADFISFFLNIP